MRSAEEVESAFRALTPHDAYLRTAVAAQMAGIARHRVANQKVAATLIDVAAVKPADDARESALSACQRAIESIRTVTPAQTSRMFRDDCLAAMDRAIVLLDQATATDPGVLRFQRGARTLWRAEREALGNIERAVARNNAQALAAAMRALDAARAAGAAVNLTDALDSDSAQERPKM